MAQQRLGIIMNGVTGRMGMNQHLIRSIVAIRNQGGVTLKNGDRVNVIMKPFADMLTDEDMADLAAYAMLRSLASGSVPGGAAQLKAWPRLLQFMGRVEEATAG